MKRKSHPIVSIFALVLLLFSCSEELPTKENKTSLLKGVSVQDDYLSIDENSFESLLKDLLRKSPQELNAWEKSIGFTSLRSIMEKAVEEETKYFNMLEERGEENLDINTTPRNSAFVIENAQYFNFTSDGWFELKILDLQLSSVLNADGVVKIGKELRKYSGDMLFVSEKGDLSALKGDLNINRLPEGIQAFQLERYRKTHRPENAKVITSSQNINSCTDVVNRYRVRLYEDVVIRPLGSGSWELQHQFILKSFRHTVWGWQRNFATNFLEGGVYYEADWGLGSDYIYANGTQHEIGAILKTGYRYSEITPPSIQYSSGEGWGRDGCHCTYAKNY